MSLYLKKLEYALVWCYHDGKSLSSQTITSRVIYESSSTCSLHLSTALTKFVFQTVPPSIQTVPSGHYWFGKAKGIDEDETIAFTMLSTVSLNKT